MTNDEIRFSDCLEEIETLVKELRASINLDAEERRMRMFTNANITFKRIEAAAAHGSWLSRGCADNLCEMKQLFNKHKFNSRPC